ncbi:T9SS outer membrane translocon Sov/SprA [Pseudopedobacter saltans]|uniref:T9SS outer membrane translocon Sov/SprA n=1 Tax=Pseudopedobacter saltans TaxID=151895 RepID=UPI001FE1DF14|nr:cell surface protein SprA [Pseudopedobacter saltans]
MIRNLTYFISRIFLIPIVIASTDALAQVNQTENNKLSYPVKDEQTTPVFGKSGLFLKNPDNIKRSVTYDPITKKYIVREMLGNHEYRPAQYLSFAEYQRLEQQRVQQDYWNNLVVSGMERPENGLIPSVTVKSKSFEKIFGGNTINIQPRGTADLTFAGRINKNENPLFNERQRVQGNFDFDQRIQMNLTGNIGEKLKIMTNYNTEAQFDFENQLKLEYTGYKDEILQKFEAGMVSFPLNTTLISGSQALFGVKTQLQFGRLGVTSIYSQQKSQAKEINITNGAQQNEFRLTTDNYEANKHYFLAQYFRNNFNRAMSNLPIVTSGVVITKIEVWVTNRSNSTTDSRDILAFMDLGENTPYNSSANIPGGRFQGGGSQLPSAFNDPNFPAQSNNLLSIIPPGSRQTNNNDIDGFFASTRRTDNYAKITYARKLTDREYTLNPVLGYISLNTSLNADEVLAVSYRYTYNGREYQVGELSTDRPVAPNNPEVLYSKLLKNETLKTDLPVWDLMMKNIYSLGAYQISRDDFRLNVFRLDEQGFEKPLLTEGNSDINGKMWIQLLGLDRLNQQQDKKPDGYFDFLEGQLIDSQNGRIVFPYIEPFGKDLEAILGNDPNLTGKYVYKPLYDSTKTIAQQYFPNLNRYVIKGTYQSQVSSEFQLNAINVPEGSVTVTAGNIQLTEGADYTVDYNIGRVKILNEGLLNSGQPIKIRLESNELFGIQQKSLFGTRFDYRANEKLNLGATIMNLKETPLTQKVNFGEESISNTIYGFDINYNTNSRFLTKLVDKIPLISTKEISSFTFGGEFAKFNPGHSKALNADGSSGGASYIDDFEGSKSIIDLKSPITWQISGTPQGFPNWDTNNDLAYGYDRAKLSFFTIDPIFYNRSGGFTPSNIANNKKELSNHFVREVLETEVFPFKQIPTGSLLTLPTLNLAYYPMLRGPYNYTSTGLKPDGTFSNPKEKWGGMFRKIETNDFEALNVEFVEMWMMDPFIYNNDPSRGGDLYINLGSISEDILKDGYKSLENALPTDGDLSKTETTSWGRVAKLQPVINAFDNDPNARKMQDVGLDGLDNDSEAQHFADRINAISPMLSPDAAEKLRKDPSSDDFEYYRGPQLDQMNAGILRRYENYNGTEGNSMTRQQAMEKLGIENAAATALPDGEDINRDNNSSKADEYYEYKISLRPGMDVGDKYITDKVVANVKLADGTTQPVTWYQFRIPIAQYDDKKGGIQDFKSIRFMRMYMTNFADTAIIRLAKLQLLRGEWRRYNAEGKADKVLVDESLGVQTPDQSVLEVSTVNIEENGTRTPIPYVVPPGIQRERDFSNFRGDTRQNEQSLSVIVKNLREGYARAAYKTTMNDVRAYKRLKMFIHAESADETRPLNDGDVNAFIRVGTDYQENYYEYEIPLKITSPSTKDPDLIWPRENYLDVEFKVFQQAKTARNNARLPNGQPWPFNVPYTFTDGNNKVTIKGQPDLSKIRTIMLGARNPVGGPADDKSVEIWFNELRLSDFDERGGWAATARMNAKLADFADVTMSASNTSIGFGGLETRISEINRSEDRYFDLASSFELGKFFSERSGIKIPMFFNYSSQISTPMYDPKNPDIELKNIMSQLSRSQKDSILGYAQALTTRRGINLTNIRKIKTNPDSKTRLWDVENFSLSYAYTEFDHKDFTTQNAMQKTHRGALSYNYNKQANFISPFGKVVKSKNLGLIKDFNFNLLPNLLNFRIEVNRLYSENTLRDNDPNNFIPINTTFNKNFNINRLYGVSWDLTKSLKLDFNATNLSVVDEPEGRITGLKRDTVWNNLKRLGRTTDYNHNVTLSYTVPVNKIPYLDFINLVTRYQTQFNWMSEPLLSLNDPNLNFGNSIQNSRTIQVNPTLNMNTLYNKFGFYREMKKNQGAGFTGALLNLLFSVKNVSGSYIKNEGTFLPGYLPKTNALGMDFSMDAPGWGFVLGSQADLRQKAIENGWLTKDTLMNQLYVQSFNEKINLRGTLEPFRDLRIEITALKSSSKNYSTNFRYDEDRHGFFNLSPITGGDYSISVISLGSAFKDKNSSKHSQLFQDFLANRKIISERLGDLNPNSTGKNSEGYADGYGKNSQDVLISSLLAAYLNKDPHSINLGSFPKVPVPNWRLTYNGLSKLPLFSNVFTSFDISHGYNSTYNVNSFSSLIRYRETNGAVSSRDAANNDFLPFYQFSQVTLYEQFVPLLGADMRFKNNVTMNVEYRKSRSLSFSLANSQLAQQKDHAFVIGFGYRTNNFRFPFGMFNGTVLKNDLNFKIDIAIRDNKTVIYRADIDDAEISGGSKNITYRPSIDYVVNQRFNLRIYYDTNITKPYTSQTFNTAFSNFGVNLRFTIQ